MQDNDTDPRCKGDKRRGENQRPKQSEKKASRTHVWWDWSFQRGRVYILKRKKMTGSDTGRITDFVVGG